MNMNRWLWWTMLLAACSAGAAGDDDDDDGAGAGSSYELCETACHASGECAWTGLCQCERSVCTLDGAPVMEEECCVAISQSLCEASSNCWAYGRCSHAGEVCAALSDADCAGSEICIGFGRCTACEGECSASCGR
jgi:hypothetical protein